jgi:hypothetical protein
MLEVLLVIAVVMSGIAGAEFVMLIGCRNMCTELRLENKALTHLVRSRASRDKIVKEMSE